MTVSGTINAISSMTPTLLNLSMPFRTPSRIMAKLIPRTMKKEMNGYREFV
jgi:hypothetical protein